MMAKSVLVAVTVVILAFSSVKVEVYGSLDYNASETSSYETIIDVSQYSGANHTEQIQAALNDVPPTGAVVVVPTGTWEVSNLSGVSNLIFTGTNGTVLKLVQPTPVISFAGKNNFVVQNFTFDGQDIPGGSAIEIVGNSSQFTIQGNRFVNVNMHAVTVGLLNIGEEISDFVITNNTFSNSNKATIKIFGIVARRDIKRFNINHNILANASLNGKIAVAFAKEGVVSNNQIYDTEHGIATRSVSWLTIANNTIKVLDRGIYLGTNPGDPGSDNIRIQGNTVCQSNIGLSKWYGTARIANVTVTGNIFLNSASWDIVAEFPATYINNTVTSASKILLQNANSVFIGTRNATGEPILLGDLNGDVKIDIKDIALVAQAYGSRESMDNWDPAADIIRDGTVDIKDLSFVAKHFGWKS